MSATSAQARQRDRRPSRAPAVVIVGAGPRGTGLLERLIANAPELLPDGALTVHVVDPYPAGAGHLWRREQSPLLWANSMAQDVTMFTDASCRIAGPIKAGPTPGVGSAGTAERLPGS
jgi:FAD-NAD(P)-binding